MKKNQYKRKIMIEVIKDFYKLSDKKNYKTGDKADFGKLENDRIVNLGLAKHIPKKTKERKQTIKKK